MPRGARHTARIRLGLASGPKSPQPMVSYLWQRRTEARKFAPLTLCWLGTEAAQGTGWAGE